MKGFGILMSRASNRFVVWSGSDSEPDVDRGPRGL